MPDETRHESADLEDYSVQEPADSLTGEPGEPGRRSRWTGESPRRSGGRPGSSSGPRPTSRPRASPSTSCSPRRSRTPPFDIDDDLPEDSDDDEEADEYLDGLLLDDGPDPRAGRLVAEDEGAHPDDEADLVARDVGIDGGAASAEEAAVHVVEDDDTDIRSGD